MILAFSELMLNINRSIVRCEASILGIVFIGIVADGISVGLKMMSPRLCWQISCPLNSVELFGFRLMKRTPQIPI